MTTVTTAQTIELTPARPGFVDRLLPDINRDLAAGLRYEKVDRFIVAVLWCHFAAITLLTIFNSTFEASERYPSPFSWRPVGTLEALIVIFIGFLAAAIPTAVVQRIPNHYLWRLIVTVCLVSYSYLFVLVSGGAIEMHFHFFMIMALLVIYSDWRLEWIVLGMTASHHIILDYTHATWVYYYGRNDISVIAHALPVLATAIFTTMLCNNNRKAVSNLQRSEQELRHQNEQLIDARAQAATDGLTDLQNHRSFQQRIRSAVSQVDEGNRRISLIMADIDNFKPVNDTCGHVIGDEVLRGVARALEGVAGKDNVYRYGGDEFAVVLAGVDCARAVETGDRIRQAVEQSLARRQEQAAHVTVSLGVACYPSAVQSVEELIYGADAAMYWAKAEGKNRVANWTDMLNGGANPEASVDGHARGRRQTDHAADTINALMAALGARDEGSGSHSSRCSFYATKVAQELGLNEHDQRVVQLSALMHDVGKLAVPDQVLLKPGPLDEREWEQMRQHPIIGEQMVSGVMTTNEVAEAVLHHHEHFNGSGYPGGLSQDGIPMASRILLVTDAFDAMTNDRPYRKAMSVEAAVEEIRRCTDTQFDREVAEAFLRVLSRHGGSLLMAEAELSSHLGGIADSAGDAAAGGEQTLKAGQTTAAGPKAGPKK